jgi:hypothetical protein
VSLICSRIAVVSEHLTRICVALLSAFTQIADRKACRGGTSMRVYVGR